MRDPESVQEVFQEAQLLRGRARSPYRRVWGDRNQADVVALGKFFKFSAGNLTIRHLRANIPTPAWSLGQRLADKTSLI